FFSSRRRHTRFSRDWSSDVCSSDLLRSLEKEDPRLKDRASDRWYVPDPTKQADLDQLRDRALLKEFEEYKASTQRKLSVFRTEEIGRASCRECVYTPAREPD